MQIQRLNMDNSWFLQMNGLSLLIDPWLEGEEIDFFSWFNTQWHRTQPIDYTKIPTYNYVLITQKYPDHYHQQTLLKLQPSKVIVPKSIEKSIKKLLPQAEIISLGKHQNTFEENGVKIQWYPTSRKIDPIYDAFLISDDQEAVFLAPHGYAIGEGQKIQTDKPIKLLISPFNHFQLPFYLGGTVAPGIEGLLHLNEKLSPQYIVATHDEDKHAKGLVTKMAKVKRIQISDLEQIGVFKNKIIELTNYNPLHL